MVAFNDMNARAQEIFRRVVEQSMETGLPVGSRDISKALNATLSPASVRNVMADLEDMGLLYAPHTSAGRMPTPMGVRLFVESVMEIKVPESARQRIEGLKTGKHDSIEDLLSDASKLVSELSNCAAIVAAPKLDRIVREIRFIPLHDRQAVTIILYENGFVENRVMNLPDDVPATALIAATNFLNARLSGQTIAQARSGILDEIRRNRSQLDALSAALVEQGLISGDEKVGPFFVGGYANLLDQKSLEDLESLHSLFDTLDRQETVAKVLKAAEDGQGIGIFIGRESQVFNHTGLSLVTAAAQNKQDKMVGVVGVIGPAHMNYGRIVPIVDYTSKVMARLIG
jgi:heat-inducible transcriptional repressor